MSAPEKFELTPPPGKPLRLPRKSALEDPEYLMDIALALTPEAARRRREVARMNQTYQDLIERGYVPAETKKWKNMMTWFMQEVEAPFEARWQQIRNKYSRSGDVRKKAQS